MHVLRRPTACIVGARPSVPTDERLAMGLTVGRAEYRLKQQVCKETRVTHKGTSRDEAGEKLLQNPEIRRAYDALQPQDQDDCRRLMAATLMGKRVAGLRPGSHGFDLVLDDGSEVEFYAVKDADDARLARCYVSPEEPGAYAGAHEAGGE